MGVTLAWVLSLMVVFLKGGTQCVGYTGFTIVDLVSKCLGNYTKRITHSRNCRGDACSSSCSLFFAYLLYDLFWADVYLPKNLVSLGKSIYGFVSVVCAFMVYVAMAIALIILILSSSSSGGAKQLNAKKCSCILPHTSE